VYSELRERGIKPGRDVAVASFDDIPLAIRQVLPRTSVATHSHRIASHRIGASLDTLLQRIVDPR
jgi:LacI family transcriptional regulator